MRATMSSVGLLPLCSYWARPEVQWQYDPSGPAAEFGSAVHEVVAAGVAGHAAAGRDPAAYAMASQVLGWFDGERASHSTWLAEPAYVLSLNGAARHVGNNIGRRYPRLEGHEVAGSADIVGISDGVAVVYDLKTGRRENVDPAAENLQLATLALAVHLAHGVDSVRVGLIFPVPGGVVTDEHTLDALDLAAWQAELAGIVDKIPTSKPQPGKKQCRYCKARAVCPAMTSALAEATPRRRLPVVMTSADITGPDHAREQYLALRSAKTALEMAWGALRQYVVENGPVDLGDGRAYGSRTSQRESIDLSTRVAVDALRTELGPAWESAVELSTSKTAIKDAAREAAKATGEKIAQVERRVLDALRGVGAVKTTSSTTFDEIDTKKVSAA